MKVECVNTDSWRGGSPSALLGITHGQHYVVLSISVDRLGGADFQLITDEGSLGVYPARCFEVRDPDIPAGWTAYSDQGYLQLSLPDWQPGGRFVSSDTEAGELLAENDRDLANLFEQIEGLRNESDPSGQTPAFVRPRDIQRR